VDLVAYAVPFFILAMLIELAWGHGCGNNTYRINDAVGSLFLGTLSQARRFITLGVGGYVYHLVATHLSQPQLDPASPWTWILAMVLYDFCYYWLHRLGHERTLLWAAHVAHHQSEDYNLSTALRQTSTGFLFGWLFYLPMYFAGIPAAVVVTVGSLNLIYQFWVHTQHIGKLGWYEWIFVTPSNHRVHHAQNERYLDRNYGGLFIIWDRIFGTFQEELDDEPPVYGIRGPLRSFNPLRALTHIYADMALDAWRTRRWRDKLRVLVARTGWRPADVAARYPRAKPDLAHFERYDPPVSALVRAYALFQLVAMVALLGVLQLGLAPGYGEGVVLVLAMLAAMVATAMWLDGRGTALCLAVDLSRLAATAALLFAERDDLAGAAFAVAAAVYLGLNLLWLIALARDERRAAPLLAALGPDVRNA
jgi:sterol desaturase/sphingolipid hydroxylase (fatty acid hydroxylase superfamily)